MNFLSEQDNKKMIKKAGEFLEGDFHVIINYSGMPLVNLSSPLLDPNGVSGSANVNRAEKTFAHDIDQMGTVQACRSCVKAVVETINSCTDTEHKPLRTILFRRYIKGDFDLWIYQDLNMSRSKYTRLRKQALLEFAQRSESYSQKYDVKGLMPSFS